MIHFLSKILDLGRIFSSPRACAPSPGAWHASDRRNRSKCMRSDSNYELNTLRYGPRGIHRRRRVATISSPSVTSAPPPPPPPPVSCFYSFCKLPGLSFRCPILRAPLLLYETVFIPRRGPMGSPGRGVILFVSLLNV